MKKSRPIKSVKDTKGKPKQAPVKKVTAVRKTY